jgi:hypothetical protein
MSASRACRKRARTARSTRGSARSTHDRWRRGRTPSVGCVPIGHKDKTWRVKSRSRSPIDGMLWFGHRSIDREKIGREIKSSQSGNSLSVAQSRGVRLKFESGNSRSGVSNRSANTNRDRSHGCSNNEIDQCRNARKPRSSGLRIRGLRNAPPSSVSTVPSRNKSPPTTRLSLSHSKITGVDADTCAAESKLASQARLSDH